MRSINFPHMFYWICQNNYCKYQLTGSFQKQLKELLSKSVHWLGVQWAYLIIWYLDSSHPTQQAKSQPLNIPEKEFVNRFWYQKSYIEQTNYSTCFKIICCRFFILNLRSQVYSRHSLCFSKSVYLIHKSNQAAA